MTPPVGVSQRHACHLAAGHTACRGARPYRLLTLGIFAVDRVWFWSVRNEGCRCCCAVSGWQCLRPTEAESDRGVRPCVNSMIITKPTQSQETTLQREKVPLGWVCFCFGRPLQGRQASSRRQGQRQQRKRTRGGRLTRSRHGSAPPGLALHASLLFPPPVGGGCCAASTASSDQQGCASGLPGLSAQFDFLHTPPFFLSNSSRPDPARPFTATVINIAIRPIQTPTGQPRSVLIIHPSIPNGAWLGPTTPD
jgi:hypothetical protein